MKPSWPHVLGVAGALVLLCGIMGPGGLIEWSQLHSRVRVLTLETGIVLIAAAIIGAVLHSGTGKHHH
ncbi:MAG TPA: hypothetical protein VHE61_23360 [Opitutaceae bacterium]|nr:hypothetical protein [Opitutaceae bacterium]